MKQKCNQCGKYVWKEGHWARVENGDIYPLCSFDCVEDANEYGVK